MTEVACIRVNGVEVGSLPAEQYRQIHRQPYRDWEAYLSQLWVALDVCYRTLNLALLIRMSTSAGRFLHRTFGSRPRATR